MKPFPLHDELSAWKERDGEAKVGEKYGNPYKRIAIHNRLEKLVSLMTYLKDKYDVDGDYFLNRNKDEIARECMPPKKIMGASKYRERLLRVEKDIRDARVMVFGVSNSEENKKDFENNSKLRETVEAETVVIERVRPATVISEPEVPEERVPSADDGPTEFKPQEAKESDEQLELVTDPEMDELLGYK